MIPYVRQSKIYSYIKMKHIAYIDDLVEMTHVSLPTVRRDLKKLQDDGKIVLLSGGGVRLSEEVEHSVDNRLEINSEEKYLICAKAAQCIENNEFIYLGPGTTENYLIGFLAGKNITVVTNGIFHVKKLLEYKIKTIIVGGQLEHNYGITYGPEVFEEIDRMNFTTCFIGASGVSNAGVSSFDRDVSVVNRRVITQSKRRILLADSTKINTSSHYVFGEIQDFDYIITTAKATIDLQDTSRVVIADTTVL